MKGIPDGATILSAENIPPGAIVLTNSGSFYGAGIGAVTFDDDPATDDEWTHTAIALRLYPEYPKQVNVLQAVGGGVEMPDFEVFRQSLKNPAKVMYPRQPVHDDFTKMNLFALSIQGKKYGWGDIAIFGWMATLGIDLSKLEDGVAMEEWFCSYVGCHMWRTFQGFDIVHGIPNHYCSPADIARATDDNKTIGYILPTVWPPTKLDDAATEALDEGSED